MKIKVVVVGYGSIGRRHCELLASMPEVSEVCCLTSQKDLPIKTLSSMDELIKYGPDYIVLASPTSNHYEQLYFLETYLSNKKILVEKPLFDKIHDFYPVKNKVYVGYNLRFNPLIHEVKEKLKNKTIWNVNVFCGSNLENWRNNISYNQSSSAKLETGGGVLLDLSHEIDYLQWIFGPITIDFARNSKISDLKIQTDDFLSLAGRIQDNINFQVTLNYFSKIDQRRIIIDGSGFAMIVDLINNEIVQDVEGERLTIAYSDFVRNDSFEDMHKAILLDNDESVCSFDEGQKVMQVIEKIRRISYE